MKIKTKFLLLLLLFSFFIIGCEKNTTQIIKIDKDFYLKKIIIKNRLIDDYIYIQCDENGTILKNKEKNTAKMYSQISEEIPSIKEDLLKSREKTVLTFECEKLEDCEDKIKIVKETFKNNLEK